MSEQLCTQWLETLPGGAGGAFVRCRKLLGHDGPCEGVSHYFLGYARTFVKCNGRLSWRERKRKEAGAQKYDPDPEA